LSNALVFSAAHVYSHIATFPSRVATALMQLTGDYLLFQLGRISRRHARNAVHCTLPFVAAAAFRLQLFAQNEVSYPNGFCRPKCYRIISSILPPAAIYEKGGLKVSNPCEAGLLHSSKL
jgi:hypothetical protein